VDCIGPPAGSGLRLPVSRHRTRLGTALARSCNSEDVRPQDVRRAESMVTAKPTAESVTVLSLEPNVWDCSMMCALYGWSMGCRLFGKFNFLLSFLLLVANSLVQLLFVLAVKSMVQENPYQDAAMLNQRLQIGHRYSEVDKRTMTTQTQQVCAGQAYSLLGDTVGFVKEYLHMDPTESVLPGRIICLLAMLTWTISVYSELRRLLVDLLLVVLALPRSRQVASERRGGLFVIAGVPVANKVLSALVMVPRFAIALGLLWYGIQFLANTSNVRELLTNAVTLEFVKTIDELLFEAIVPRKLMGFVRVVKLKVHRGFLPYELVGGKLDRHGYHDPSQGRPRHFIGVQTCYVLLHGLCIFSVLLAGSLIHLEPFVEATRQVYQEICGGNTNFTYMIHPVTRLPVFASMDPYVRLDSQSIPGTLRCFYAAQYEMLRMRAGFLPQYARTPNYTLMSFVNGSNRSCWSDSFLARSRIPCPEKDVGYFNYISLQRQTDFYSSWQDCRDQDVAFAVLRETCMNDTFRRDSPQALSFFDTAWSCADLRERCQSGTLVHNMSLAWMWRLQKVCPETCGLCTHVNGSSAWDKWSAERARLSEEAAAELEGR